MIAGESRTNDAAVSLSATQRTPDQISAAERGEAFEHESHGLQAEKIGDLLRYVIVDVIIL
jgi:hypothetical protein